MLVLVPAMSCKQRRGKERKQLMHVNISRGRGENEEAVWAR